jgi:protein involved in polysaccharide export with SLBB domain
LLRSLAASITLGRLAIHIEPLDKLSGSPDDILLEDGDALFIPQQPTSVAVIGAVRNATAVLHKDKENMEYYINRAGGTTREADVDQIFIVKADGSAVASFVPLRYVEAGDTIVVPISTEPKVRTVPLLKDLATIVAGFAVPVGVIAAIAQ